MTNDCLKLSLLIQTEKLSQFGNSQTLLQASSALEKMKESESRSDTASRSEDRETAVKSEPGPRDSAKRSDPGKPNLQGFTDGKKKNRFSLNTIGKGSVRMRYVY